MSEPGFGEIKRILEEKALVFRIIFPYIEWLFPWTREIIFNAQISLFNAQVLECGLS